MFSAKRILALPLVLLALVVQGMTPAAAAVMTARMADPFASMPICSADAAGERRWEPGAPANPHRQLCDTCSVCSAPAALVAPEAPLPAPPLVARVSTRPAVEIAGPRGPPPVVPRARGPPAHT